MTRVHVSILFGISLISGACMSAPTQSQSLPQPPASYTGMDDVLIPTPPVASTVKSEMYPFTVLSVGGVDNDVEMRTRVYITSGPFDTPISTVTLADRWIARHSDPKSKFKLLTRSAVESNATPPVLDDKGKVFSPLYTLIFESQGAVDYPWDGLTKYFEEDEYRQMFYFLPVSNQHIFTSRVVREVRYFEGFPQFEPQYEHFLATLKRESATPQSTLKGSKPRARRFYTAHFSFEIYLPGENGGDQWLINKSSSQRSDLWHTKEGDIIVGMGVISGYDFEVARKNQRLMGDAKGLVTNLPGVVKSMDPDAYVSKLKYLELPFVGGVIYGHAEEDTADRGGQIAWKLDVAYKTGKQLSLSISGPAAAMNAQEKDLLAWLSQFKILQ